MNEKTIKKWKPEQEKRYWFICIDSDGDMYTDWYNWQNDYTDKTRHRSDNYFKTKKEAQSKLKEIKKILKSPSRFNSDLHGI